MLNRKKQVVGLDIGNSEVKAVELTHTGDSLKITGFGRGRFESEDQIPETVNAVLNHAGIKCRRVVTSVSGRSVIVRYINLPYMETEELKSALRYEADKYIPFEIDEVTIDGERLEEMDVGASGEREMKVLLVAAKKSLIQEHVGLIQEIGLTPLVVDVDSFALGNAYELANRNSARIDDEERVVALVDIGATKTNINIMRGNTSYFSREVYLAGDDFTDAVARHLRIETMEAEELKRNPQGREPELEDALLPTLDDLANEIHLSFDYFENQFDQEVVDVLLSGGSARTPGLVAVFERVFDRKVQTWDPTENLELKGDQIDLEELKACACQLPIAVGLGSRLLTL